MKKNSSCFLFAAVVFCIYVADIEGRTWMKTSNPKCLQPAVTGLCYAAFHRFYFDSKTGTCKTFIFGGCGGNDNNFETRIECLRECGP